MHTPASITRLVGCALFVSGCASTEMQCRALSSGRYVHAEYATAPADADQAAALREMFKELRYPFEPCLRSQEGEVRVRLVLLRSGEIARVWLGRSSGVTELDVEALRIVNNFRNQGKKLPWPKVAAADETQVVLEFPIEFRLR